MLKVTVELTESNAPPQVYCLSEGDVKVEYGTREMLSCFGGPPNIDLTGGITITVEGIRANKGGTMPNWRKILAVAIIESSGYLYCGGIRCGECIFIDDSKWCLMQYIPNNQLLEIDYHLLETVEDWSDTSEIKTRIAEMLDDDAREKFLGKAEPEKEYERFHLSFPYARQNAPELKYAIQKMHDENHHLEHVVIAFRDEATRDRVLAFLNGDTK